jgi:hypothetical protein
MLPLKMHRLLDLDTYPIDQPESAVYLVRD